MFFLQMSGFPGSGKSTLSKLVSKITGAVVIDHDVVKSALLESLDSHIDSIDSNDAGKISYNIEWALIDLHLSQGHSVILDSPCFYSEGVETGIKLAKKHNVDYKYVECYLNDLKEIDKRLKQRDRMISQIQQVSSEEAFRHWVDSSKKPSNIKCLVVDTSKSIDAYINDVIRYLNND